MDTMKRMFPQLTVWLLAAMLLGSCQIDGVDISGPGTPDNMSEAPVIVPDNSIVAQRSDGVLADVVLNRLLGRVTRLVTPLLGGTLPILNSSLVVPPFAVLTPLLATWELRVETPVGLSDPLSRIYEFWPDGTIFLRSTSLNVSFVDAGLGSRNPYDYRCYYFNEQTGSWEVQPTIVDMQNQRFVVTIDHFSRYAFGR